MHIMSGFLCCFKQNKNKIKQELTKNIGVSKNTPLFVRSSTLENRGSLVLQDTEPEDTQRRQGKFFTLTTKKVKKSHPLADYVYPRTFDQSRCVGRE